MLSIYHFRKKNLYKISTKGKRANTNIKLKITHPLHTHRIRLQELSFSALAPCKLARLDTLKTEVAVNARGSTGHVLIAKGLRVVLQFNREMCGGIPPLAEGGTWRGVAHPRPLMGTRGARLFPLHADVCNAMLEWIELNGCFY